MGKIKSKVELEAAVVAVFAHNKTIDTLFQTEDGQCFEDKHFADFHARTSSGLKITEESRKDFTEAIAAIVAKLNTGAAAEKAKEEKLKAEEDAKTKAEEEAKATEEAAKKAAEEEAANADPKYGKWKLAELREECNKREIVFAEDETRRELIAKLEAADADAVGK